MHFKIVKRKDVFLGAFALGCKICYSLDGSGYYYERDKEDSWTYLPDTRQLSPATSARSSA